MKRDDFINDDDINELIRYVEEDDDDTPTEDEPPEEEEKPAPPHRVYEDGGQKLYFENDKKNTRFGVILGIVIGIAAIVAFVTVDSGIIGNYKNNFANNYAHIFRNFNSDPIEQIIETPKPEEKYASVSSSKIISFEQAKDMEFAPYRDGIVCAKANYMAFIDKTGQKVWETETAIVEPILKASGSCILLAEKDGNKICLYAERRLVYDVDDADSIVAANVSEDGDVIVVTDKSSYRGGISVYNKSGDRIYSWASGSDAVISADIAASSRCVAVSLLNTESTVKSTIMLFDVNKTQSYASIDAADTVIFDLDFKGGILNAFGENRIIGISEKGGIVFDNAFADAQLTHSAVDDKGNKLLSLDDGNIPLINMYNKKGALKASITLTGEADFIDIDGSNILYNMERDIYFGKINSKNIIKHTAAMDIKDLIIITDNTFMIVYSNSIEIVTV